MKGVFRQAHNTSRCRSIVHESEGNKDVRLFRITKTVKISQISDPLKFDGHSRKSRSQRAQQDSVSQTVMERTAETIAESAHQASRATGAITDAIEDGVGVVRHAEKQGCDTAEEFLDDTARRLPRHLALTVMTTFAVGVAAGALNGWMMKRR